MLALGDDPDLNEIQPENLPRALSRSIYVSTSTFTSTSTSTSIISLSHSSLPLGKEQGHFLGSWTIWLRRIFIFWDNLFIARGGLIADFTICISTKRNFSSLKQTPFTLEIPAGSILLAFSVLVLPCLVSKLLCSCMLEGRWSQPGTHRSLSPPLAQLFLPPGGAKPQMCANESFSLFTGFGMLWQTITSLHSQKTGGTQTSRLWMATALTPRYLSGAPHLTGLEKIPVRKIFSNSTVFAISSVSLLGR